MGAEIDAGELVLRPVGREVALALLEGRDGGLGPSVTGPR